jgi:hypothetical protein
MTVKKCFDLTGALTVEGDTLHDRWGAQDAFVYEITGVRLKTRVNSMD